MRGDLTRFLWLLKLGMLVNLYFLGDVLARAAGGLDARLVVPASILFAVSGYRCLFPNRYVDNVVFHDTVLSSTFVTRVLATFTEVAYVSLFSHVLRLLNVERIGWVDALSWLMVAQAVVSQGFVWGAILTGRVALYFWEELGWAVIFAANTLASLGLYTRGDSPGETGILLVLNLLFGLFYLPWQALHLRALRAEDRKSRAGAPPFAAVTRERLAEGLRRSVHERRRRTDAEAWGGWIGLTWMTAYWVAVIPVWVHCVVVVLTPPH